MEIQRKIVKEGVRCSVSRSLRTKNDQSKIATWKAELDRILYVFDIRSIVFGWHSLMAPSDRTDNEHQ